MEGSKNGVEEGREMGKGAWEKGWWSRGGEKEFLGKHILFVFYPGKVIYKT